MIVNQNHFIETMASELLAYCLKTKTKEAMQKAVITKTARGGFIAKGETKEGHKISLILSGVNAQAAVKDGAAKQGW